MDAAMTINGKSIVGDRRFGVVNPATGEVFAEAPECSDAQLDGAMHAAEAAQRDWKLDEARRRQLLHEAADALDARADEIAPVLTAEQGKPLSNAAREVHGSASWLRSFADLELPREVIQDDEQAFVEVVRRPVGVVAAITPWNFPVSMAAWKIAPALLAGNTLVLKPSPFTPLATLMMGEAISSVLPPGVVNVVSGGDSLGAKMTEHPIPRKVSFTGSVATGKRVNLAAAPDLKRVTLELGGNDPAILLDDVDPEAIADQLFWSAFFNSGQVCTAIKRMYVPESIYTKVVDALADRARAVRVGDGMEPDSELGPINNRPQFERVSELVAAAVQGGAQVAAGGSAYERPGYFFQPTVLAGVSEGARVVDEEQFGPVLPIISYRDIDDAIERANATHYGLGGSVWTSDDERGYEVASRIESGTAWVNSHGSLGPRQPFGGAKWSGLGVEHGTWGVYSYTDLQVLYRAKSPTRR